MLGKTARGLFWMYRYLERAESLTRLIEAGLRIALTRSSAADNEWESVLATVGVRSDYGARYPRITRDEVVDFLLRDESNPSSVLASLHFARDNARGVRTALTREVWEATNDCWITMREVLEGPIPIAELPARLADIRGRIALVRGLTQGTMLRNDIYDFSRIGTYLERADNSARIIDVKYYVLLPSVAHVGGAIDNSQWDTILRAVSADRAYKWLHQSEASATSIAHFLVLDARMPRSLLFCVSSLVENLDLLSREYERDYPSAVAARAFEARLSTLRIEEIIESGLHEFLESFVAEVHTLGAQIETDFRFYADALDDSPAP